MAEPITILIVEDHRLMAEGLASLLGETPELKVVGTAGSVQEAVTVARSLHPQVVLMDFRLPDGNGAEATQRIKRESPEVAVLFLSADISDDAMMQAVDAGACGYVSKAATAEELTTAIRRAGEGEFLLPAATMSRLLGRQREARRSAAAREKIAEELTTREHEVLKMMAAGLDNYDIAEKLGIGYGTVRSHVRGVLEKLGARSRLQAVALARETGLITG
ncbi:MAG TPA: response regulator transcription factor [Candidatus Dormibacteraeota bacterium]|jgi:two-component system, NarL family, response regulator DevR